jgi:hypothetical protein
MKLAHNGVRNVLGLETWVNTLDYCEPVVRWELPAWLRVGQIESFGFCGFSLWQPLHLLFWWLTLFGLAPVFALRRLVPDWRAGRWQPEPWLGIAFVYGLASFLAAPVLGSSLDRLIGYGWPAFWVAVPVAAVRLCRWSGGVVRRLLAIHLALSCLPALLLLQVPRLAMLVPALVLAAGLLAVAWSRWRRVE